jgi:methylthioribose-1-phosphate isomerase
MLPTIARESDAVVMIDQRKLPAQEIYVRCKTAAEVARAIKTMVIRGAPAIGVAAAMGIAIGMRKSRATGTQKFAAEFHKICELMAATRPTAVNLFWAIERMKRSFAAAAQAGESVDQIKDRLDREAVGPKLFAERAELRLRWPDGPRWALPVLVSMLERAARQVDRRSRSHRRLRRCGLF